MSIKKSTYEELMHRVQELEQANSELENAAMSMQKSENILRILIRTIPDLVWFKDQDGVYRFCNSRFEDFFGTKEKNIINKTDYDFVDSEIADFFRKNDEIAMANGGPSKNEEEVVFSNDGHREILETIKLPIFDNTGQALGVLGIGRDITAHKKARKSIERTRSEYESILANLLGISYRCLFDKEWTMIYMSPHADQLTGYPPNDFIYNAFRTYESIIHREDTEYVDHSVNEAIKCSESWEIEYRICHKDGKIRWVYEKGSCVEDDSGKIEYLDGFIIDITARKRLEEQLLQSQKMESIGTLAGGIAHDFNNILSPIMVYTEMAMMRLTPDHPVQEGLHQVFKAGERAKELVKQILTFARKSEGERVPVKISLLVQESINFLRSTIPSTIDIQHIDNTKRDTVLADPTQLNQVVINLCTNAAHSMEKKGGTLELVLENEILESGFISQITEPQQEYYIKLSVKDTGQGIEPHLLSNIFEPYYTTKSRGKGTGMGLALVHGIVHSHGGEITVESNVGKGTCFTVHLPLVDEKVESSDTATESTTYPGGKERILCVDDEPALVDLMQSMLGSLDYQVIGFTNSIEAIAAFRNSPQDFDLVITDQTMPNMTGKELAKEILELRPDIHIILCTGFSDQINEYQAKKMGISAFLSKPIEMENFSITIREILGKKKSIIK